MFEDVNVRDLDRLAEDPNVMIVDLRDKSDYKRKHIKNAINIEYDSLSDKLYKLDKSKIIILYCERGSMSLMAARDLNEMGYQVKTVIGGFNMYKSHLKHNF